MSESKNETLEEQDGFPGVEMFDVQAFREDGTRDERAEQIAHPRGFIPGEQERAESVAKRCNALNLTGVEFKIVSMTPVVPGVDLGAGDSSSTVVVKGEL